MYRCNGITQNSTLCEKRVKNLRMFCYFHLDQEEFSNMRDYVQEIPSVERISMLKKIMATVRNSVTEQEKRAHNLNQ